VPVQVAEPLVTLDEWDLLQAALDTVQAGYLSARPAEASPLAGVAVCFDCGVPLHHSRNAVKRGERRYVYRRYRCQTRKCVAIPADILEELAEESFLYEVGDLEVRERVWVPGDSHEAELREAVNGFDELTKTAGRAVSAAAKQRLQKQLDALDTRIAELESAPAREARWEYRTTGGTYRSVWEASDTVARRELLVRSGIKLAASIHGVGDRRTAYNPGALRSEIRVPAEITENLG
jgi:site-specific DNA recombinase